MIELPPIPDSIPSQLGPVIVVMVPNLKTRDGDEALGLWWPEDRTIKLCAGMGLVAAWTTLKHEWLHQVLWDAGVGLAGVAEERVCDAVSTALVAEMLNRR